jgi:alkanesulfonate monooxygenase SsuD/methylene tetrahydromethanopterin reductase-like flavin-dependent oxidoreductase (luciferase family)
MSGSSPESGTMAARNRLGLGLAFTTVPLASKAAQFYREEAGRLGWHPGSDQVIYRMGFHVAETDERAMADMVESGGDKPHVGLTMANKAVLAGAVASGYFGKAAEEQKERVAPRDAVERVEKGQILLGSPETVWKQICRVRDEVGAGILDLFPTVPIADRTRRSIELFGTKLLPRLHEN